MLKVYRKVSQRLFTTTRRSGDLRRQARIPQIPCSDWHTEMVSRYPLSLRSRRYPRYEKALQATRKALARWCDLRRGRHACRIQVERRECRLRKPRAADPKQLKMKSSLRSRSGRLVAIEPLMKPGVLEGAGKEGGGGSMKDPMISQQTHGLYHLHRAIRQGPPLNNTATDSQILEEI